MFYITVDISISYVLLFLDIKISLLPIHLLGRYVLSPYSSTGNIRANQIQLLTSRNLESPKIQTVVNDNIADFQEALALCHKIVFLPSVTWVNIH